MTENPLDELLLDADQVNKTILASALKDLLGIDNKSGKVIFKPKFDSLNSKQKIIAFLLGKKVSKILGKSDREDIAPKDIPLETGIIIGTVHPTLKYLRDNRYISQTESGDYYIAAHQVNNCISFLHEKVLME